VGTGANYPFGPYIRALPDNPFTNKNIVTETASSPAAVGDVTANNAGGWLFNKTTGEIWADHADYVTE
jgi:hypothetical protein